jgi:long-subunit fatty acid transport protein
MRHQITKKIFKIFFLYIIISNPTSVFAQDSTAVQKPIPMKSEFWKRVRFGGGLGLNFANNATAVTISPSGVYDVNKYVSVGVGLQGSYVSFRDSYKSYIYGGSLIGLFNPLEGVQLSTELEQLRVNTTFNSALKVPSQQNWNTALFLGAGYVTDFATIGIRYNVLFKQSDNVYGEAFMPFVRVFF